MTICVPLHSTFVHRTYLMKKQSRNFLYALVLLTGVLATTACNRGYGCPTDFSLEVEQPSNLD